MRYSTFLYPILVVIMAACSKVSCDTITALPEEINYSFVRLNTGTNKLLNACHFIDSLTGFVVGRDGIMLKTTDGGLSFLPVNSGTSDELYRIQFTSANVGYAIGNNRTIIKTIDQGVNWQSLMTPVPGQHFRAIQFFNDSVGIIAGATGKIFTTKNGGQSWTLREITTNHTIYSMHWYNLDNGVLGTNWGGVARVKDSTFSITYTHDTFLSSNALWDLEVQKDKKTVMVANGAYPSFSKILNSKDTLSNFNIQFEEPEDSILYRAISFVDKTNGLVAGGNLFKSIGALYTTGDEGKNWKPYPIQSPMLFYIEKVGNSIFLVGDSGVVFKSTF